MTTVKVTYIDTNDNNHAVYITDKICPKLKTEGNAEDMAYTAISYFKNHCPQDCVLVTGVELLYDDPAPERLPQTYSYSGIQTKADAVLVSIAADEARAKATGLSRYIGRILSDEFMFSPDKAAEEILTKGAKPSCRTVEHFKEWYERLCDEMSTISNLAFRLQVELDCLCGNKSPEVMSWNKASTDLYNLCNDTE